MLVSVVVGVCLLGVSAVLLATAFLKRPPKRYYSRFVTRGYPRRLARTSLKPRQFLPFLGGGNGERGQP